MGLIERSETKGTLCGVEGNQRGRASAEKERDRKILTGP